MPRFEDETQYVETTEYVAEPVADAVEYVEEVPVAHAPIRRKETLAEVAAEGPMDWPDDGSPAKHQGYIDHDPEWQLRHNPPVVEEHHGRDGILDDDISLALANEIGQRGGGII